MQQLSGYFFQLKFDPEMLFSVQFQYRNRIAMEFNQLYHWHPLMPDSFKVGSQEYSYEQFLFNTSMLVDYGVEALVDSFSRQNAGRVSLRGALLRAAGLWSRTPVLCCEMGLWPGCPSPGQCGHSSLDPLAQLFTQPQQASLQVPGEIVSSKPEVAAVSWSFGCYTLGRDDK